MNPDDQSDLKDTNEQIDGLIRKLHDTEQELRDLTGGEVDAVMHPAGNAYLLHKAQSRLLDSETAQRQLAVRQSAILNALPAHIALLDGSGVIVSVNDAWRDYATDNALHHAHHCLGYNYVDLCLNASGSGAEDAHTAAIGIRSVLTGISRTFELDYPCHSEKERSWFRMLVSPLQEGRSTGVVVAHINITERKLVEERANQSAARLAALVAAQQELSATADDAARVMDRSVAIAQRLTDADGADFEVIVGDMLICRAVSGMAVGHNGSILQLDASLSGLAIRENQTLRCDDIETDWRVNAALSRTMGLRSMIVAVLRSDGKPVGVIKSISREPNKFGDDDAHILELFAQTLGTVLQRMDVENELRIRARQHATIAELGLEALTDLAFTDFLKLAAERLARSFNVEFSVVMKVIPDRDSISIAAGYGWPSGIIEKVVVPTRSQTVSGYTLLSEGPIILDNVPEDPRFKEIELLRHNEIVSGISVAIRGERGPWGSLAAFSTHRRTFTQDDIAFVQSVGNLISQASRRQSAEQAIAQQAALLDKTHDAIIVRNLDQVVQFWNKGAERLYGWTKEEVLGTFANKLIDRDTLVYAEAAKQVFDIGEWSGITQQRRKDGSNLTVHDRWTLISETKGEKHSIFSISTDVTREALLEEQLRQAQRLEAVGELTGGIAHDFNNLLTIILGNSELLVEDLADNEALRMMAEMTLTAAKRGAELTHRLLAFARRQPLQPKVIDVNDLLQNIEPLLRRALREDIDIRLVRQKHLWRTLVDPSQLESAVLNLCINARDAMQNGGQITIETMHASLDEDYVAPHSGLSPGDYVTISVSDNGSGISLENLAQVFDPFFTTKDVGKGSGLGLSMVYGFAKQSHGHVKIDSELGTGTAVTIFLPKSDLTVDIAGELSTLAADAGGTERILLVEDDELVSRNAERQLVAMGYHVTSASQASTALEIIKTTVDIDLLFTDIVMPGGTNGRLLADEATRIRPGLKVLFTSGYAEGAFYPDVIASDNLLLRKPYSRNELASMVRAAIEADPRKVLK